MVCFFNLILLKSIPSIAETRENAKNTLGKYGNPVSAVVIKGGKNRFANDSGKAIAGEPAIRLFLPHGTP